MARLMGNPLIALDSTLTGQPATAPTFSPGAGAYSGPITIASVTPGCVIYYTIDGSTPTYPVTGTTALLVGSLTLVASTTVKAIAYRPGMAVSTVASAAYTLSSSRSKYTQPFVNTSWWNTPASVAGSIGGLFSAPVFGSSITSLTGSLGYFVEWELNLTIGASSPGYAVTQQFMYIQSAASGGAGPQFGSGVNLLPLSSTNAYNSSPGDSLAASVSSNKYSIPDNYAAQGFNGNYGDQGWTGTSPNNIKANFCWSNLLDDDATVSSGQQFSRYPASSSAGTGTLYDTPALKGNTGYSAFSPNIKTGDGRFGPHGGSRMSALGGSLRLFDLEQGVIAHCLKVVLPGGVMFNATNGSTSNNFSGEHPPASGSGYGNSNYGYVEPAYCQDSYAYGGTNGNLKIGSLLQIPSSTTLSSLGTALGYTAGPYGGFETALGEMFAVCAQNYGIYVVDTTGTGSPGYFIFPEATAEPDPTTGNMVVTNGGNEVTVLDNYCINTFGFSLFQYGTSASGGGADNAYVRDLNRLFYALCTNLLNAAADGVHGSGGGTAIVPYLSNTFSN